MQQIVKLGVKSLPATLIDGELIRGFDRDQFSKLLLGSEEEALSAENP